MKSYRAAAPTAVLLLVGAPCMAAPTQHDAEFEVTFTNGSRRDVPPVTVEVPLSAGEGSSVVVQNPGPPAPSMRIRSRLS